MTETRSRAVAGLTSGAVFTVTRTFTREETVAFGNLTRDYNPVHYEPRFAAAKGFQDLIAHGLLVGSMICEIGGQLAWLATDMRFCFRRPVLAGDTITCRMTITEIDERGRATAEAVLTNQDGVTVIEATLGGHLPAGESAEVLSRIVAEGDATNGLA